MYEKDRDFVRHQVLRVMADWGVTPGGRGSGEGDVEYWVDVIIAAKGWEPYWEESRMPREFQGNGHVKGAPSQPPVSLPSGDPYMAKLNEMHDDIRALITGLRSYFR